MNAVLSAVVAGADARVRIWSAPRSTATTLSELPHAPAVLAAKTFAPPTPASHSRSFLIRTPEPPDAALSAPVSARTTASCPPYPRNSAATIQSSAFASLGVPKTLTSCFSLLIDTISPMGPFWKDEANAAVREEAPTMVALVRSRSLRTTPGET